MYKILVVSNSNIIRKIFYIIEKKLNSKITFVTRISKNNSEFDLIILDDEIQYKDIELTLLNSHRPFGLLMSGGKKLVEDFEFSFILKKPFLPKELFENIKDVIQNIDSKSKKVLEIDEPIDFVEKIGQEIMAEEDSIDFLEDIKIEEQNNDIDEKESFKIDEKDNDDIADWNNDLDFLIDNAINETDKISSENKAKEKINNKIVTKNSDKTKLISKEENNIQFEDGYLLVSKDDLSRVIKIISKYKKITESDLKGGLELKLRIKND